MSPFSFYDQNGNSTVGFESGAGSGSGSGSGSSHYTAIGIATAICGNLVISIALNVQRYAHLRLQQNSTSSFDSHSFSGSGSGHRSNFGSHNHNQQHGINGLDSDDDDDDEGQREYNSQKDSSHNRRPSLKHIHRSLSRTSIFSYYQPHSRTQSFTNLGTTGVLATVEPNPQYNRRHYHYHNHHHHSSSRHSRNVNNSQQNCSSSSQVIDPLTTNSPNNGGAGPLNPPSTPPTNINPHLLTVPSPSHVLQTSSLSTTAVTTTAGTGTRNKTAGPTVTITAAASTSTETTTASSSSPLIIPTQISQPSTSRSSPSPSLSPSLSSTTLLLKNEEEDTLQASGTNYGTCNNNSVNDNNTSPNLLPQVQGDLTTPRFYEPNNNNDHNISSNNTCNHSNINHNDPNDNANCMNTTTTTTHNNRKSINRSHSSSIQEPNYLKSSLWWLGATLMSIGEVGNFVAYGFAPASVVSPLGVLALVSNCIIAPMFFNEPVAKRNYTGVAISVFGILLIITSVNPSQSQFPSSIVLLAAVRRLIAELSPHDFILNAISQLPFKIYLTVVSCLIMMLLVGPTIKKTLFTIFSPIYLVLFHHNNNNNDYNNYSGFSPSGEPLDRFANLLNSSSTTIIPNNVPVSVSSPSSSSSLSISSQDGDDGPFSDLFSNLGLVALFGAFTALSTKALSSILNFSFAQAIEDPLAYLLLLVLVSTAVSQVIFLNRALQRYNATVVIPVHFVFFTISVIIGSAITFHDFENSTPRQLIQFFTGCVLTFVGVWFITASPPPPPPHSPHSLPSFSSNSPVSSPKSRAQSVRSNLSPLSPSPSQLYKDNQRFRNKVTNNNHNNSPYLLIEHDDEEGNLQEEEEEEEGEYEDPSPYFSDFSFTGDPLRYTRSGSTINNTRSNSLETGAMMMMISPSCSIIGGEEENLPLPSSQETRTKTGN